MTDALLRRIAEALERLAPATSAEVDLTAAAAFLWDGTRKQFDAVPHVARLPLGLLRGIDMQKHLLLENTQRFASGLPANNALLWGARGMGKSSIVKAVHAAVPNITLIEIHREDIETLPLVMRQVRRSQARVLLFCDDLSFEGADTRYKALKAALEGGIEGRPENLLFYATSNRRHLVSRDIMENESTVAINPRDSVDDKVALSDRFGLWIGFHTCSQDDYFEMIRSYAAHYQLPISWDAIAPQAIEWSATRGARSGRVAWQFVQDLAGRLGVPLKHHPGLAETIPD
jgi:uncharacterized protein